MDSTPKLCDVDKEFKSLLTQIATLLSNPKLRVGTDSFNLSERRRLRQIEHSVLETLNKINKRS